ncbi:type II toxin-antitoxin system RelE/ParE family toxin [Lacunimicrobium album]
MKSFRISPEADQDLFDIAEFISVDRPESAIRVTNAIIESIRFITQRPHIGIRNSRLPADTRIYKANKPADQYLIFFQVDPKVITITAILHGRRDWVDIIWKRIIE